MNKCRVISEPSSEQVESDGLKPYIPNPYPSVQASESTERVVEQVTNTFRYENFHIRYEELSRQFADVFSNQEVGCISQPYDMKLVENSTPALHAPRRTPFTLADKVKNELHRMEKLNVLQKVDEATEWVNSMTVTEKPNGQIRVCLNPPDLNRAIVREHSPLPSDEEIMTRLRGSVLFSKLDARDGYWQVPLTERASYLTTFNTLIGRFRYLRLPFGTGAVPKFWNAVPQIVKLFHKKWNCSTKSGTVPLCAGLLGYCRKFPYRVCVFPVIIALSIVA